VLFFQRPDTTKEKGAGEDLPRMVTMQQEELGSIMIEHNGRKVGLERTGGTWMVTSSPGSGVNQDTVNSLVSAIMDTVVINMVEEHPANPAQYGFDKPDFSITLSSQQGQAPCTVLIGNDSPTSTSMYAMIESSGSVLLIGTYLRFSLKTFFEKL